MLAAFLALSSFSASSYHLSLLETQFDEDVIILFLAWKLLHGIELFSSVSLVVAKEQKVPFLVIVHQSQRK